MRYAPLLLVIATGCFPTKKAADGSFLKETGGSLNSVVMPSDRLQAIKAALPQVAFPRLAQVFQSPDTLWYDHESIAPSYQKSTGGPGFWGTQTNANWIHNIPDSLDGEGRRFVNPEKGTWVFPFATTEGTDDSTNIQVANFINLPRDAGGNLQSIAISVREDPSVEAGSRFWEWTYPAGTMIGEVIFIKDGQGGLLPSEVRIRQRYGSGWAMNAYRPFPRASDLSAAVKARRPQWQSNAQLSALVAQLDNPATLTPKGLHADLRGTFDQDGFVDQLPDFGDGQLVRELLTQTTFATAYEVPWKQSGTQKTYAATTTSSLSIVPNNYTAGLVEVSDTSCMRCHKETARLIDNWTDSLVLYGEVWGKDGIFSLHPFDERYDDQLTVEGIEDNRHLNPKLQQAGIFRMAR